MNSLTFDYKILVAEDDHFNQTVVLRILERAGATVTIAANGRDAVRQALGAEAEGEPFDAILMDLHMPEIDGLEATRILRENGCRIPIIAFTAEDARAKCKSAGCDAFLQKPFRRAEFFRTLAACLGACHPRDVPPATEVDDLEQRLGTAS